MSNFGIYSLEPVDNVHPLVKVLFEIMQRDDRSSREIAGLAGVAPVTLVHWCHGTAPGIYKFCDVAQTLGLELVLQEKKA